MNDAELAAQFEKQVRSLYPDGEMPAAERELLLELASAQGLSRGAAEGVLAKCRPKAREVAPAPKAPPVGKAESVVKKPPVVEATSAPEPAADVEPPPFAQPIPVVDAPPPLLEKRRERAIERLAAAKKTWVFRCVVAPMAVLVLIGAAVAVVSTWWNGSNEVAGENAGVGTSAEAPTEPENAGVGASAEPPTWPEHHPESAPVHAMPKAVFRDVLPASSSRERMVFMLPEVPTAVVDVPDAMRASLRLKPLPRTPAGEDNAKVVVEGRASGASGWLPLLEVQLDAAPPRVVCTADPSAVSLLPGFGDHFVPEVTGAKRDMVYRCRRRTSSAEVLETMIDDVDGKVTFGTVRVSYPWPGTLTVRAKGETTGRAVQSGVQRWTRGGGDPVVVEVHLTVGAGDVGLSLRSPELETRCRAAAVASADLRKAEAGLARLPPEAAVSRNPLDRKRYEAQRYRQALEKDDREHKDATEELRRVREQLARVDLDRKRRDSLLADQGTLAHRLSTLEVNRRRNTFLLAQADREVAELERRMPEPPKPRDASLDGLNAALRVRETEATRAKTAFEGTVLELVDAWGLVVTTIRPSILHETP